MRGLKPFTIRLSAQLPIVALHAVHFANTLASTSVRVRREIKDGRGLFWCKEDDKYGPYTHHSTRCLWAWVPWSITLGLNMSLSWPTSSWEGVVCLACGPVSHEIGSRKLYVLCAHRRGNAFKHRECRSTSSRLRSEWIGVLFITRPGIEELLRALDICALSIACCNIYIFTPRAVVKKYSNCNSEH